jgi:hypothetical protein
VRDGSKQNLLQTCTHTRTHTHRQGEVELLLRGLAQVHEATPHTRVPESMASVILCVRAKFVRVVVLCDVFIGVWCMGVQCLERVQRVRGGLVALALASVGLGVLELQSNLHHVFVCDHGEQSH